MYPRHSRENESWEAPRLHGALVAAFDAQAMAITGWRARLYQTRLRRNFLGPVTYQGETVARSCKTRRVFVIPSGLVGLCLLERLLGMRNDRSLSRANHGIVTWQGLVLGTKKNIFYERAGLLSVSCRLSLANERKSSSGYPCHFSFVSVQPRLG